MYDLRFPTFPQSNRNTCDVVLKLENSISVITNTMKVVVTNEWMDGYK